MRCQIWDDHTRQESGPEVWLNFIPERRNTRLNCLVKPGILKPCLRIRYINSISLTQSFYPWMIRDMLYSPGLVSGELRSWLRFSNWLWIIHHCWFREYREFSCDFSIRCAWNRQATHKWNQTRRLRRTWKHESRSQISVSQSHMDNIERRCAVNTASTHFHQQIYSTAEYDLVYHSTASPAFHHIWDHPNEARIQFTRYLFTIDIISDSSL